MESFPMQYQARGAGGDVCERLRATFHEWPFVATVGTCHLVATSADPDAPTSSG